MAHENRATMGSTVLWLTVFAIALAYMESTVVVYLRFLYYPDGFSFPIRSIPNRTLFIELAREAFTIILLYSAARLAFRKANNRFCGFILAFGVWDIFYYIWLYISIGWPESFLTWDILFLIPVPWIGPVVAPALVALTMVTTALIVLNLEMQDIHFQSSILHWAVAIIGGLLIIVAFTVDYRVVIQQTIPVNFKWWLFFIGELVGLGAFLHALMGTMKSRGEVWYAFAG